jgi:ABC-type branched-subunit amino acid transport system substrate-binding protein
MFVHRLNYPSVFSLRPSTFILLILSIFFSSTIFAAETATTPLSNSDIQRLGEQMYREGILPSGQPMQSVVKGDIPVSGTSFTCVSCHMRSGLGSIEGGVFTTPTNGRTLYEKRDLPGSGNNRRNTGMNMASKKKGVTPIQPPTSRPAYTDETLADVLRGGKDPSGRMLDMIMPRYNLSDSDMAIMVAYLKTLSNEFSPGVDDYSINFATIITEGVPADQADAMMNTLNSFVTSANQEQKRHQEQLVKLREIRTDLTYRPVRLFRWTLKGKPETWQAQLDELYRKQPVFALIAGISDSTWKPIHEFSESNKIPCILPNTEFPVVSDTDWYTLYFSKGFFQEGGAAARFILPQDQPAKGKKVLQIVRKSLQGLALAKGFEQGLKDRGLQQPVALEIDMDQALTSDTMKNILDKERPDVLALWTGSEDVAHIAKMSKDLKLPSTVLVSSGYLGQKMFSLPEQLRDIVFITYPYRLPHDEERFLRFLKKPRDGQKLSEEMRVVQSRVFGTLRVLTQALREIKGNFYRDYLYDTISMMADIEIPLYERMSFGPGQRYASKGCYVVQLGKGSSPELIKRSEWVIH